MKTAPSGSLDWQKKIYSLRFARSQSAVAGWIFFVFRNKSDFLAGILNGSKENHGNSGAAAKDIPA
jgi:hypothetical protein